MTSLPLSEVGGVLAKISSFRCAIESGVYFVRFRWSVTDLTTPGHVLQLHGNLLPAGRRVKTVLFTRVKCKDKNSVAIVLPRRRNCAIKVCRGFCTDFGELALSGVPSLCRVWRRLNLVNSIVCLVWVGAAGLVLVTLLKGNVHSFAGSVIDMAWIV